MPTFRDAESAYALVPEGDYVLCVFEFTSELSTGKRTNGARKYNLVFNIEGTDSKIKEVMIDHPSCDWKIDTFLKSSGLRNLAPGLVYEFEKIRADEKGVPWINPMGLRCTASIVHETYTSQRGNEVTKNKIAAYHTDREILAPDPVLRKKPTGSPSSGNPAPF